jgi:hypothetical protein
MPSYTTRGEAVASVESATTKMIASDILAIYIIVLF